MDIKDSRKPSVSFSRIFKNKKNIKGNHIHLNNLNAIDLIEGTTIKKSVTVPSQLESLSNIQQQTINEMPQSSFVPQNKMHLVANGDTLSALPHNNSQNELVLHRRPSALLQEILTTRRPSVIMAALSRPTNQLMQQRQRLPMGSLQEDVTSGSTRSIQINHMSNNNLALESKRKNRRIGDDALSTALSALYAKIIVIMGVALPVTEILTSKIPIHIYQGFYVYLYVGSILFVIFIYTTHCRTNSVFTLLKRYHEKHDPYHVKKRVPHFGSFYLRVGAIAFGIGNMVYSGLEIGQYVELRETPVCANIYVVLRPAARMALSICQMQFIFFNTTELDMAKHKVIARFGLMHMVATNLCEWLYVLVEETKHEIYHLYHENDNIEDHTADNSTEHIDCHRINIMGHLVQNASPFLFPCTIEYSLICAVILYEMWKKVRSLPDIERSRRNSQKLQQRSAHHFSIDCARSHRGMFAGIIMVVLTIIALIMYFVLHKISEYKDFAIQEITITEILMYSVCTAAVVMAMIIMRDLKYCQKSNDHHSSSVSLDCTLLILAQTGVYVYAMFSIMGCYFAMLDGLAGGKNGLIAEILSLMQTSIQTLFILNASWRRCKGSQQIRKKPGREIVTFLLVANMSMWFINTLIKGHAGFRPTHLTFFGTWAWTVITHVSMPLAIFYRFHSTICLFEIWKSAYKVKNEHH